MKKPSSSREETKFNTMDLLKEVEDADMADFSLDDIMREFGSAPKISAVAPLIPSTQEAKQTESGAELLKAISEEAFEAISEEIPEDPEERIVDQIHQAVDIEILRDPVMTPPDTVIRLVQEEETDTLIDAELNSLFRDRKPRSVQQNELPPEKPEEQPVQPKKKPEKQEKQELPEKPVQKKKQKNKKPEKPEEKKPVKKSAEGKKRPAEKVETPQKAEKAEVPPKKAKEKADAPQKKTAEKPPKAKKQPKPPKLKVLKEPKQEPVPDAGVTFKKYSKEMRPAQNKSRAVLILLVLSVVLTIVNETGLGGASALGSKQILSKILLGIMVLCALLSLDVIRTGIKGITELRFTANSMIILSFLITAIDAVLCTNESKLPFCAVVCLQFFFADWGNMLRILSVRRSLKVLMKPQEEPKAAGTLDNLWKHNNAAVVAGKASTEEHVRGLLGSNLTDRCMGVYVPVVLVLSLVMAIVVHFKSGNSLTWAWSSMMICGLPVGSFICYYHPFATLSGRLMKEGAAVSGWTGAERLANSRGILIKDQDIFPTESVTLNGMKVYGSYTVGEVTGYAAAVMETSESGLAPLFMELRANNKGRMFTVSEFRIYEGGGYGAEIGGDVVLVGSLRFMQLMGVYMREGTKVRDAVYLAVNKEMCAVFALNYAQTGRVRKAMRRIEESGRLTPVFATRDFLITPALVHERYKISADSVEFPGVEDRNRLFGLEQVPPAKQGAILSKQGFSAFAGAVTGSGVLRTVTRYGTVISIIGGILGLVLMFYLTYMSARVVSAMNVLLFPLLWTLPVLVLSGWVKRY